MVIQDEKDGLGKTEPFKFFLLGMLWTNRPFRNVALFSSMKALWRAVEDIDFVAMDDNRFLITRQGSYIKYERQATGAHTSEV